MQQDSHVCEKMLHLVKNVLSTRQMAAEEVGWGDDEDDAASPTAAGPPAAGAPSPALAATAAAAASALPAVSPSEPGTATRKLPAVSDAADASQSDTVVEPTEIDRHPAPEPDEVATASDSTDGGAGGGERWTVVSTGTPTKASAAAAALPLESDVDAAAVAADAAAVAADAAKAQDPAAPVQQPSPAKGGAVSTAEATASKSPAEPGAAASPSAAAKPAQKPVAAVADEDDDDDLADVEVPEGGDGSEVDEDWGAQLLRRSQATGAPHSYTLHLLPLPGRSSIIQVLKTRSELA